MLRRLLDTLFPPREDEKLLRTISDDDFLLLVAPRLAPATRPGTVVLLPFHEPRVRSAIHEMKYHGNARARTFLALGLGEYLRDNDEGGTRPIIVPIPLGAARYRERGFNQIEEVARVALRNLGHEGARLTLEPFLLSRTRETVSQVSLPRHAREENMRGAFSAAHPLDPARTYLVIDDVLTTGATLQAAIDALRAAGATSIIPLALAH